MSKVESQGLLKNSVYLESRARHASPLQDFMRFVGALLAAPGEIIDFFNSPSQLALFTCYKPGGEYLIDEIESLFCYSVRGRGSRGGNR
jgi:hypothetical protein